MRRRRTLLLGSVLALVAAAPAAAAEVEVKAVDPPTPEGQPVWDKPDVTIKAGDTVVWTFAGTTLPHNVTSSSANWSYESVFGAPTSFVFATSDTYLYYCKAHPGSMTGKVTVTDAAGTPPPPPPPPPPGQQPFTNDSAPPGVLETGGLDVTKPTLSAVRVRRASHGATIRFHVSELAVVTVRFKRGGKTVKSTTFNASGTYHGTLRKGLRSGRYRVELRAEDVAGNRSGMRTAHVTVR
jgi:plastocyanin